MKNDVRQYFPFFEQENGIAYLDNSNTTQILGACLSAYIKYHYVSNYNIGRASYTGARNAQQLKDWATDCAADFLGTKSNNIIWTTGSTEGLNIIANSFYQNLKKINKSVVLLTTKLEHASAILPWMTMGKYVNIKYIETDDKYNITTKNVEEAIKKYKPNILLLSSVTNTTGSIRPIEEIGQLTKANKIVYIVDHSQGAAHIPINVEESNINFLTLSLHKMYGPKGVGVLYAKNPDFLIPLKFGGGMNKYFNPDGEYEFLEGNDKMYAGTENVPAIFVSTEAFDFVKKNMQNIIKTDIYLGTLAYKLLSKLPYVHIYSDPTSPILLFNVEGYEALDIMNYLDKQNIYIRGGNHCAKLTKDLFGLSTCRASFGIYNTDKDVIRLYGALKDLGGEKWQKEPVQEEINVKLEDVEQMRVR